MSPVAIARGLVLGALLAALGIWIVQGGPGRLVASVTGDDSSPVEVGRRAPDVLLREIDGTERRLSEWRGQVVVMNFWATWCTPCRAEMPALQAVYESHRSQGLVVLGVDVQEPPDRVSAFLPEVGVSFPILLDRDMAVAIRYRATGLPATFIIDRDQVVRDIRLGPYTEEMLLARIEPLLR